MGNRTTWARLRSGHALIKLGERFGAEALDRACRQAIAVDLYDVRRLQTILLKGLERDEGDEVEVAPAPGRYARPGAVFAVLAADAAKNGSDR